MQRQAHSHYDIPYPLSTTETPTRRDLAQHDQMQFRTLGIRCAGSEFGYVRQNNAHRRSEDTPIVAQPFSDVELTDHLRKISKKICEADRRRFLICVCGFRRKQLEDMLDFDDDATFDYIEDHLEKVAEAEKETFFRSYAPKMKASTQIKLQDCNYRPRGRLRNVSIYDIVDSLAFNRRDFLLKIGINTPIRPLRDRCVSRKEFIQLLDFWWENHAEFQEEQLLEILAAAECFASDQQKEQPLVNFATLP